MRILRLLLPALLLAALIILPSPAAAAKKSIWGPVTLPNGNSAFPLYAELGVDVFQIQLSWFDVAPVRPAQATVPTDPAYKWPSKLDTAVAEAGRHGIEVAIMIKGRGTPAWANGGRDPSWAADAPGDLADFATAASRRYGSVRYWMVWGETTQLNNFNPMPPGSPEGPRRYALLLDATYAALKAVRPSNLVIGGMTHTAGTIRPAPYIRWMRLPDGSPPRMDFYGHNPLSYRFPVPGAGPEEPDTRDLADLDLLSSDLRTAYARTQTVPRLWLSEYTISSDRPNRAFSFAVTRAQQAKWLKTAYQIADSTPSVFLLGWYALLDDPGSNSVGLTTGLMTYEGQRKPAWTAFARARSARAAPQITAYPRQASRRTLAGRGLAIRLRARTGGLHAVELRRGAKRVAIKRTRGPGSRMIRLRAPHARPGAYAIVFVSPRGETLSRPLRIN